MMRTFLPALFAVLLLCCPVAQAEVTVVGTRAVFPAGAREISVTLKNEGQRVSLVQAWVSDGGADQPPEASKAPFVVDRPMFRLDPGTSHSLRVRGIATGAPVDAKEHLYWLNVVDVPPRESGVGENVIQVAVRFRLKLLYRPEGVGAPSNPDAQVSVRVSAAGLDISNAAPHYFNVGEATLESTAGERALDSFYVAPGETKHLAFPAGFSGPATAIRYSWVDDDGALHAERRELR
ncbi:TPA: molecular chaperone [Stenotrophomonas maltophilia]